MEENDNIIDLEYKSFVCALANKYLLDNKNDNNSLSLDIRKYFGIINDENSNFNDVHCSIIMLENLLSAYYGCFEDDLNLWKLGIEKLNNNRKGRGK